VEQGTRGNLWLIQKKAFFFRATKSEIIIEDCPVYVGHSGGPCVNQDGMVIGILCRGHPKIDKRYYLVPAAKLKVILNDAQKIVDFGASQ